MPYIEQKDRAPLNEAISRVLDFIQLNDLRPGDLNYILSTIIWHHFMRWPSYTQANELIGVLECVKQEFYRRKVAPLEDAKIAENGDLDI
jgi:hypothetical protein